MRAPAPTQAQVLKRKLSVGSEIWFSWARSFLAAFFEAVHLTDGQAPDAESAFASKRVVAHAKRTATV